MSNYEKITNIDNEIQANYLNEVLKDKNIPHRLKSYHDSALNGLYQATKGWGIIEAPKEYKTEILTIVDELTQER